MPRKIFVKPVNPEARIINPHRGHWLKADGELVYRTPHWVQMATQKAVTVKELDELTATERQALGLEHDAGPTPDAAETVRLPVVEDPVSALADRPLVEAVFKRLSPFELVELMTTEERETLAETLVKVLSDPPSELRRIESTREVAESNPAPEANPESVSNTEPVPNPEPTPKPASEANNSRRRRGRRS